ncbi:protein-disulfide reductase DsbD family protein [Gammaproteobacteria bacterium]|nr:protein-disulfide reductase DsbD family protein [Gammaproteobacteria bacterium]
MKFYKLLFLLSVSFNVFAVSVDTGHANVSLVKYNFSENGVEQNLIGIKMDMQKNWHTYWKNPGDSGGPIKVKWSHEEDLAISEIFWPTPSLIPYDPLMTYGYKDFVIFPFKFENSGTINAPITADIDFLICDDICVPEKAYIETTIDEIVTDINLQQWFAMVPTQTLPAKVSIDNNYIEIRFSNNDLLSTAIFFINDADIVEHAAEQILVKEENNWLLKIKKLQDIKQLNNISGVLAFDNGDAFMIDAEIDNASSSSSNINFIQALILDVD